MELEILLFHIHLTSINSFTLRIHHCLIYIDIILWLSIEAEEEYVSSDEVSSVERDRVCLRQQVGGARAAAVMDSSRDRHYSHLVVQEVQ